MVNGQMQLRPGVIQKDVCGEHLLLAIGKAEMFCPRVCQINETAAFLCRLLERKLSKAEITDRMKEEYGIPESVAGKDLEIFLKELENKGYLVTGNTA